MTPTPPFRSLRGYALDPGFSTRLDTSGINEFTYRIRWEDELKKGPVGEYFEVIDYDAPSNCFYDPVDLNSIEVLAQNGVPPSEGNPKFHQQFVYTIAMQTLEHFEQSLGRKVIWAPRRYVPEGQREMQWDYVPRLRLYPHGFRGANAFYAPDQKAISFGYFEAARDAGGPNMPGGTIFTCLSPDIIAHELTHALLESIHPRFSENTNADVAAFHEAFADVVALLQRFTITPLVEHQIARTRGNLGEFSFLGELATQFSTALGEGRGSLRGAIGGFKGNKWVKHDPDPAAYHTIYTPHLRGGLLVAVFFDALIRVYEMKTADLIRIATNGSGILQPGAIHPDLVKRLAGEVADIARHMLHIAIRALDYCPPLDINFGDYLRALITADLDTAPRDENGYRIALIEAFRSWGIFPERVKTMSIESLCWSKPDWSPEEKDAMESLKKAIKNDVWHIADLSDREAIYKASIKLQATLHTLLVHQNGDVLQEAWPGFLQKLGLSSEPVSFVYDGETVSSQGVPPIEVHKVRPVYRVGREDRLVEQVLITLTQTFTIKDGSLAGHRFRGGCTLILDMTRNYDVEYVIYRKITSEDRFRCQMDFQLGKNTATLAALTESMYDADGFDTINLAHLHFHDMI